MKLKRLSDVLSRLIDITLINTTELNDFSVGSTILSIYEATSMEIEQYYMLSRENIIWGIEQGVLNGFDFYKREARKAYGEVTVEFHTINQSPLVIPRGSSFDSISEDYRGIISYETIVDHVVPSGTAKFNIEVFATRSGTIGNLPKNAINRMINGVGNISRVYNQEDFLTGADEEDIESVKRRFHAFIESRGRATVQAIDYGARTVEDITGVYVNEQVGLVNVYVHDMNGNLPKDIHENVEDAIEAYRPAGIKLVVLPVEKTLIDLDVTITTQNIRQQTDETRNKIVLVIRNYINSQEVSKELVLADLVQAIMNIDDMLIYDCVIDNYKENIKVAPQEILRAGNIDVAFR